MSKKISTLAVGAKVRDPLSKYYGVPVGFQIADKNHAGYPANSTTLAAEKILCLKAFDAKESGGNSDRQNYGNNRYSLANIRQWLNKSGTNWYQAQHSYDRAPGSSYVWSGYNAYDTEAGFKTGFSPQFLAAILPTTLTVAKPTTDGGGSETVTDDFFLPSKQEVGLGSENGIAEGSLLALFNSNNSSRLRTCTPQAIANSNYTNNPSSADNWYWRRRSPLSGSAYYVRNVISDGDLNSNYAWRGNHGVRPALFLAPDTLVSDTTDTDGAYIIQWNQPPTTPSSISHGTPRAGQSLTITTGGSTDPEGDAISYVWERRVDSGAYTQIGITSAKSIVDTVPSSGTNYQVRVKAVDANGAESAYRTGNATPISYNTDPVISGSDQNLGAKTDPFTYDYTVTDSEAASQTLTVTETVTNGTETITLRTYTATSGTQNTADLSDVWLRLLTGSHVLKIYVTDGAGGSATRLITFSRTVTRIAASRAIATDAKVEKVFLSLYPADHPADATLHVEVTNNPFDDSPAWEDITSKVGKFVHTFTNTTVASSSYGLAYRFYMTKGTQEIEVIQATVRFA